MLLGLFSTYERSHISVTLCHHLISKCHVLIILKKKKTRVVDDSRRVCIASIRGTPEARTESMQ